MKKILKISIILFVVLILLGYWYWQKNIYSRDALKLEIASSRNIGLFEEVEYMVNYKNNGNVRLEEVRLVFEFPEFTVLEEGKERRQEVGLEDIYPGEIIAFEELRGYPEDAVIVHVGFQAGLQLNPLERIITRKRKPWQQTTTCFVVKQNED